MDKNNIAFIENYISNGQKEAMTLKNFYDTILVGDIDDANSIYRIPIGDFFIKYRKELDAAVQWHSLKEEAFYKPKMVSYRMYGTTELWLALLRVNNMKNVTEFHRPLIRMYNAGMVKELISIFFKREGVIS